MSKGIITLCGSTRFYKLFDEINYKLTLADYIVLSIGCHTNHDACLGVGEIVDAKQMLDRLHKEKIMHSDAVVILDKDGYIGESTQSELKYAIQLGKPIYYYNDGTYKWLLEHSVQNRDLTIVPLDRRY